MRYATNNDHVQDFEIKQRAAAAVRWAISTDTRLNADPLEDFRRAGWGRYGDFTKSAVAAHTASDALAAVVPLNGAFQTLAERVSILPAFRGATRVPITPSSSARIQTGTVTAAVVAEASVKPVSRLTLEASGAPSKIVGQLVATREFFRSFRPEDQNAIRDLLASAVGGAQDVYLVGRLTSGTPAPSASIGDLLALVSSGAPRSPVLVASWDAIAPIAETLRALRDLGLTVAVTPAAQGFLIVADSSALLIGASDTEIRTATHASLALDDGLGSPTTTALTSLWQTNQAAVLAESYLQLDFAPASVASRPQQDHQHENSPG